MKAVAMQAIQPIQIQPIQYDAIIIGAGLAGCSTAIQLAQRGHRVLLLEQQRYPTHKLCGEFLSVEVISSFERLGILGAVRAAGAAPIRHASVTTCTGQSFHSDLPGTALGLSRYALDLILIQRAAAVGATCRDGTAVTAVTGDLREGFTVTTRHEAFTARMVMGAYGKCSGLDRSLARPFMQRPSPFIASKAHYTGIDLPSVVELHAFPGGYCGLSQIEAGRINVCWIAHGQKMQAAGKGDRAQALSQNPVLAERLASMECLTEASQSLSQISFALKGKFDHDIWMIGDTAGMIAPLCGDGMAMALRSAELAVPMATAFLQGQLEIQSLKRQYSSAWNHEFRTRLQLGRLMHYGFIEPAIAQIGVQLCRHIPALGDALIRATRGASHEPALAELG
jgi:menaquinone-9 beta-reductase